MTKTHLKTLKLMELLWNGVVTSSGSKEGPLGEEMGRGSVS